MPVHLGSMGESVETVIARRTRGTMQPGDVYVLNAPYNGGTHLPDITVDHAGVRRRRARRSCSASPRAATTPTSAASRPARCRRDSTHDRGGGRADRQLPAGRAAAASARRRCARCSTGAPLPGAQRRRRTSPTCRRRSPPTRRACSELRRMVAHFGLPVVRAYMSHVQDNAEESVRRVLDRAAGRRSSPTRWTAARVITVTITRRPRGARGDDRLHRHRAAAADQLQRAAAGARAAVLYVFRTLVDDDIPMNAGCLKPLDDRRSPRARC